MNRNRIDLWRVRAVLKDRRLAVKSSILGGWFLLAPAWLCRRV